MLGSGLPVMISVAGSQDQDKFVSAKLLVKQNNHESAFLDNLCRIFYHILAFASRCIERCQRSRWKGKSIKGDNILYCMMKGNPILYCCSILSDENGNILKVEVCCALSIHLFFGGCFLLYWDKF